MNLWEKAKEKVLEQLVASALTLTGCLATTAYLALPRTIWTRVDDAVTKRQLWLLLAALLLLLVSETSYLFVLRRRLQWRQTLRDGFYWDARGHPFCPQCEKPARLAQHSAGGQIPWCPKCEKHPFDF